MESLLEKHAVERLTVPSVSRGVAQHPFYILHLGLIIAAAFSKKRPPDIAVQIDRFPRPMVFRDMKNKYNLAGAIETLL